MGLPHPARHRTPERGRHGVGRVQPPAGRAAVQPVGHHAGHVVLHRGLVVVERDQLLVAFEVGVAEAIGAAGVEVEPEPGDVFRGPAVGQHVLERPEPPADVVEHPIQQQLDATVPALLHQVGEVLLGAEPRIDPEVIDRVVAVSFAGEDGPEQEPVATQIDQVVQPGLDPSQPRGGRVSGEAERVQLPPDRMVRPAGHGALLAE